MGEFSDVESDVQDTAKLSSQMVSMNPDSRSTCCEEDGILQEMVGDSPKTACWAIARWSDFRTDYLKLGTRVIELPGLRDSNDVEVSFMPSQSFENKYTLLRILGKGAFATVSLCRENKSENIWAVKSIKKGSLTTSSAFPEELEIFRRLKQANIVTLQAAFEDEQNFHLVMENLGGGNLSQALTRRAPLKDDLIKEWIFELLCAVVYLHHHHLCHRDIKCENILLESKTQDHPIKLIDFGLSTRFEKGEPMRTVVGSSYTMAPELLSGRPYSETIDIWSSGCVAFELCTGHAPYVSTNKRKLAIMIKTRNVSYKRTEWQTRPKSLQQLVQVMLDRNPKTRCGAKHILQHNQLFSDHEEILAEADPSQEVQQYCTIS